MNHRAMPAGRQAFTLVELLVVIAIIGLLSSVAVVATSTARAKARDAKRMADKNQIIKALNLYYAVNNSWPASNAGDWVCFGAPTSESCWVGGYTGIDALRTAMSPYMANFPTTSADSGNQAYNRYLYAYNPTVPVLDTRTGAALVWPMETTMTSAQCPGSFGKFDKYWYCYEYLGPP